MKTSSLSAQRGSAFITVMMFCAILLMLIGSILHYSTIERRFNNRAKLLYESRTAAEAISEFGIAQVKNILESNRTFTDSSWSSSDESMFVPSGTYAGLIGLPPNTFWQGGHIVDSTGIAAEVPLMHVGKVLDTQGGGLKFIDPTNPDNANDPLKGKRVFNYALDILSRATAVDSFGGGDVTKYMKQTFAIRAVPLFANAVYYNMDLEVQPGPDLTITGSTHTNGRLFARSASASPIAITFAGPVTAVKGFWTNFHTSSGDNLMPYFQSINDSGALQTNATTGIIQILPAGSTVPQPMCLTANTSGFSPNLLTGTWVESTWNLYPVGETWQNHLGVTAPFTETVASKANFANWIQQTFLGNLLTNVNGLSPNNIQGIPDYSYVYGSLYPDPNTGTADAAYTYMAGGNDIPNSAHALIESPRLSTAASYNQPTEAIKYAHNAGLYIVANTTGATANGHMPDGTVITVAARSYRAFMNDTTVSPNTITEVILPGQDNFGPANATANPYTSHKNARPIVQLMNIDFNSASGTYNQELATQRRMIDMRRTGVLDANLATATTTFDPTSARSALNTYIPKNLFMIDIDMTELKKALRTISVATNATYVTTDNAFYLTGVPVAASFANYIYNPAAVPTNVTLNDNSRIITTNVTTLTNAYTAAIWNGAVYVESIAADSFDTTGVTAAIRKAKTYNNRNSGVRLVNGRGKVPSDDGIQGFTLATNDVAYILGDFNADGDPATPAVVAVTVPPSPGASTGHNYETGELPASIVADAIYLLSEPNYTSATTQTAGWNDAFSAFTYSSSNYNAAWATTPPSGSNMHDGTNPAATAPFKVPYDTSSGALAGTTSQTKLPTSFTEYSVALLMGLVPTGKNGVSQTSGGLHNFPRFLEGWNGVECRIRGAMVALFECRVGTEPWNLRVYSPPLRVWGFNLLFDTGSMPPLTPKTVNFRRSGANDITKTDYNAKLTAWGYPTLP
jgi:hypothetical protein